VSSNPIDTKATVHGVAKGATPAADATVAVIDANTNALHVTVVNGSGVATDVNVAKWIGSTAPSVGQKAMAASLPVTIASNQPAMPIVISGAAAVDLEVDYLKNGVAFQMKVNGLSTPQVFQYAADPVHDTSIFEVRIVFSADSLNWSANGFGKSASGILTNGIIVDMLVNNGVAIALSNLKVNLDFLRTFGEIPVVNSSTTGDIIVAAYRFADQLILKGGTADTFRMTIRDDLTVAALGIQYLSATFYGHKV
jgi:hypothetical protein